MKTSAPEKSGRKDTPGDKQGDNADHNSTTKREGGPIQKIEAEQGATAEKREAISEPAGGLISTEQGQPATTQSPNGSTKEEEGGGIS